MSVKNGAPRLVCFDLGGVVVRICRSWEEACARAGIEVRAIDRFRAPTLAARRHEITHRHQIGAMNEAEFCDQLAAATDGLYDAEEVRRIHAAWIIEDYPGMARLIGSINQCPVVRTACLSNTNAAHWDALRSAFGPAHRASEAILRLGIHLVSHELRAVKPGEAIYQLAARTVGVDAHEILFFDDLAENVEAARRLGWRAELVDHTGDPAAQVAAYLRGHGLGLD